VPEDLARQLRFDASRGWVVAAVEKGGPGAEAGLERGHLVTAVDGQPAGDMVALGRHLQRRKAGESVTLNLLLARRRGMLLQVREGRAELRLR
jgi:serine protease Do